MHACLPVGQSQRMPHLELLGLEGLLKLNHLRAALEPSAAGLEPVGAASNAPGRYAEEGLFGCGACVAFFSAPSGAFSSCRACSSCAAPGNVLNRW